MNYKRSMTYLLLANLANIFVTSIAGASVSSLNLTPYGGVDLGVQNIKFKSGYGDNLFKSALPKGNFYLGLKFNEYFGIEGGYETTLARKKDVVLTGPHDHDYFGAGLESLVMIAGDIAKLSNKIKISGLHLGITGEYPVYFNKQQKCPLSIIGYVGIKNTKIKLSSNLYYHSADPTLQDIFYLNKDNKKYLIRLSAGLQYFMNEKVGLRLIGSWEKFSKLSPKNQGNPELLQAKLKNSLGYSLGLIFKV